MEQRRVQSASTSNHIISNDKTSVKLISTSELPMSLLTSIRETKHSFKTDSSKDDRENRRAAYNASNYVVAMRHNQNHSLDVSRTQNNISSPQSTGQQHKRKIIMKRKISAFPQDFFSSTQSDSITNINDINPSGVNELDISLHKEVNLLRGGPIMNYGSSNFSTSLGAQPNRYSVAKKPATCVRGERPSRKNEINRDSLGPFSDYNINPLQNNFQTHKIKVESDCSNNRDKKNTGDMHSRVKQQKQQDQLRLEGQALHKCLGQQTSKNSLKGSCDESVTLIDSSICNEFLGMEDSNTFNKSVVFDPSCLFKSNKSQETCQNSVASFVQSCKLKPPKPASLHLKGKSMSTKIVKENESSPKQEYGQSELCQKTAFFEPDCEKGSSDKLQMRPKNYLQKFISQEEKIPEVFRQMMVEKKKMRPNSHNNQQIKNDKCNVFYELKEKLGSHNAVTLRDLDQMFEDSMRTTHKLQVPSQPTREESLFQIDNTPLYNKVHQEDQQSSQINQNNKTNKLGQIAVKRRSQSLQRQSDIETDVCNITLNDNYFSTLCSPSFPQSLKKDVKDISKGREVLEFSFCKFNEKKNSLPDHQTQPFNVLNSTFNPNAFPTAHHIPKKQKYQPSKQYSVQDKENISNISHQLEGMHSKLNLSFSKNNNNNSKISCSKRKIIAAKPINSNAFGKSNAFMASTASCTEQIKHEKNRINLKEKNLNSNEANIFLNGSTFKFACK